MKKVTSILLAVICFYTAIFSITSSAYANETLKFHDYVSNKDYAFDLTSVDYRTEIYQFVADELSVPLKSVHIIVGTSVYYGDTIRDFLEIKSSYGASDVSEVIIDNLWTDSDDINENWLGDYENTTNYYINSEEDMAAFYKACFLDGNNFSGKTITLQKDLDLSKHFWEIECIQLMDDKYFSGVFDGNNHSVKGLRMYPVATFFGSTAGLFPYLRNGVIKNLSVSGNAMRANVPELGFLVGLAADSAIYNCSSSGDIECIERENHEYTQDIGGLIGRADHCAVINCSANTNISNDLIPTNVEGARRSGSPETNIGGLIAKMDTTSEESYCLLNSYSLGTITLNALPDTAGGLVGFMNDDVYNCYSLVNIERTKSRFAVPIGTLFGKLETELYTKDENNEYTVYKGDFLIGNLFYQTDTRPIGRIESLAGNEYDDSDFVTEIESTDGLYNSLNDGTEKIDEIINEHRDILENSTWADLVKQCGAEDFVASKWYIIDGINGGFPSLHATHSFESTVIPPTTESGGYTLHKCTVCGYEEKDSYTEKLTVSEKEPDLKDTNTEQIEQNEVIKNKEKTSPETGNDF